MSEVRIHAGIDVSARSLSVCVLGSKKVTEKEFCNSPKGHAGIVKKLSSLKVTHVCLEATGNYSLDVALALVEAGFSLMVANPRAVHHFAKALMQRSKTDPLDARCLAEFCARMPFQAWCPPAQSCLEVRSITRRIAALKDLLVQEKNRRHSAQVTQTSAAFVLNDIEENIAQLQKRIGLLEKEALSTIEHRVPKEMAKKFQFLLSVPGIGNSSALSLFGELCLLSPDMDVKQWVGMAGLDPRLKRSGTSVHSKVRISKAGNARIRKALFLPALTAIRYIPEIKLKFQQLKSKELNPLSGMQAVIAIMRKLLHAIFAIFKHSVPFCLEKAFPNP